ncbi:Clp protease N-terminal domain-containing protein [Actinoplanes sp. NPDC089786]|uniref:Clp protease N-terminal domain-containing protein n=1 Tax=Actinoplanes sp. NPDC089786 TaxID=3155185 RepID=UPI00341A63C6
MSGFKQYLTGVMDQAVAEALRDRSATVEAQHLLLVILAGLDLAGLDADSFRAALDRDFEHSLGVAGVALSAFDLSPATPDPARRPGLGNSVRLALDRAMRAAGAGAPQPDHLLIGILSAEVGPVPRALAQAGVDREELLARLRAAA